MDLVCHLAVCKWTVGKKKMLAQGDVDPFTLKLRNKDKHKGKFHSGNFFYSWCQEKA